MLSAPDLQRDLRAVQYDLDLARLRLDLWVGRGDADLTTHLRAVVHSHQALHALLTSRLHSLSAP